MPKLSVHIFMEGERVPMLHDERGLPLFYPTLFATSQLRNAGAAVNTIRNKLTEIAVLLRWEQMNSRDLIAEFRDGNFLTVADVCSLRDFAKLDMRELLAPNGEANPPRNGVVQFLEAGISKSVSQASIGGQQHFNRLSTFADYLEFTATVVTQHQQSEKVALDISRMARTIRKHRPRGLAKQQSDDLDLRSPPPDVVDRFMAVGSEGHLRNPFRNPDIQLRNAIIFGLLRYAGIRRGELLSLRLDQVDLGHEPKIWVRRNHDDRHDSRRYQPVAKTKERALLLPETLGNQINRYLLKVRARIAPARKHPYMLVSHRKDSKWGQPLSSSTLNSQIFARMRAVDEAFEVIHPHAFRHHWNYELSVSIDKHNENAKNGTADGSGLPITEARELDIRAFANGHRNRASGAIYNRRHIKEASDRAARQVQDRLNRNDKQKGSGND